MDDLPNTASMPQPEDSIAGVMDDLAHEQAADVITHQKILFEALIESVLDGILIVSAEGRMLHLNQRFADIWHFPAEIIQSKSDEAALQWAANQTTDPAGFLARVADVYTQPDQEVREEVLMKDGRAYERFGAPIRSGGNWLGWVWTFRDITERKQVEERLRESEHHYRLITQTATDVIITIDANSIILFINDAVVTMFGYTAAELLGKNLNMLMPEAMRPRHNDSFKRYLTTGKKTIPWTGVEISGLHKDGTTIAIDISFGESTTGAPTFTAIIRDITARKQSETVLRESEARFRTLADNISQFAWMTDETGYFFWYNQRWFDYTGTTLDEMQGWGWQSVHHPDYIGRVTEKFRRHLETGEAWEDTFPLRSRDGEFRWFLSRALPITDEQGKIMRWFGTNTDITDQRVAELQLENYTAQLQRSNRELESFAAVASHDLQEPLRKIQTFGDRLRATAVLNEQGEDYLTRMQKAALRMQELINDLISFSRVTTKAQPFVPVELGTVARAVVSDLEVLVAETQGRVELGELPTIDADPMQMRQLLQNLIGNALKFHKPDVAPQIQICAELGVDPDNGKKICRLSVADNGIGFEEQYLDRIFTVFERLHGRQEYEGTGIGLAICRRIAERHGGHITARSQPGQGANFIISLPLQQLHKD